MPAACARSCWRNSASRAEPAHRAPGADGSPRSAAPRRLPGVYRGSMTGEQPKAPAGTDIPAHDVEITDTLARSLLSAQHPDLADLPLRRIANGWDNVVYRLGDDLALRLPRRKAAHQLLLHEVRWLPFLAPRLPLPIPAALRRGRPNAAYPYHWAVVPWFDGASAAELTAGERDHYAGELGRFLRALHVPAPADAPRNPVRGVPLATRSAAFAA